MRKAKYWIIFFVFLLSQVLTGAALAETPAQEKIPEEDIEQVEEVAIDAAGTDVVAYGYAFSHTSGAFTPITGGLVHGTASNDDTNFPAIDIGFTFKFDGVDYTQVSLQSNGWIAMGATITSSYTPLSTGSTNNVIAALARDLQGNATNSELMSLMEGTEPNRVFTIQWLHYKRYGSTGTGDDLNFQIKLYETTNKVEIVYGTVLVVSDTTVQVGLRGAGNTDFNNRTTITDWLASTAGMTNTDTMILTAAIFPSSGLTYNWDVQLYLGFGPSQSLGVCRGTDAIYDLTAVNGTGAGETVDIAASGNTWTTTLDPTQLILQQDESAGVQATVHVPWSAATGAIDTATVTATGQISGLTGSATLTTTSAIVGGYADYTPVLAGRETRDHSVVYKDGKLYKIGGYNGAAVAFLDIYDIATDSWSTGADMPGGRYWIDCEAIGDGIYCAGGYLSSAQSTLYRYDIPSNSWTTLAALPAARYSYESVAYNGKYYVIGGYAGGYVNTMLVYDPATDTWDSTLAPMATARRYFSAGLIGAKIYVAGGYNPSYLSSVEVYDIVTNSWVPAASMPITWLRGGDAVLMDRYLVIIGGAQSSTAAASNYAWIYDSLTDQWGQLPVFSHMVYGTDAEGDGTNVFVVSGRLYDGSAFSYSQYNTKLVPCDTVCTPVTSPDFTFDPTEIWMDNPVTFTGMVGGGSPAIQYNWDFGDMTSGSGQVVEHTFTTTGNYPVTLTVTNCDGLSSASISHTVTVIRPPTISIDPTSLHATQHPDVTTTQTFEICNIGDATLDWELKEVEAAPPLAQAPVPEARKTYEIMRKADGTVDCAAYENYSGFEPAEVAAACPVSVPIKKASGIQAPTDIGYAQDIGYISDNFVSFALNNFPGQTVIGTNTDAYYGMDFDVNGEVLWALNDTTDQLGTIDLTTGAFTPVVACPPPVDNWTGMTIDPVTGTVYASTATDLYTINPTTGASTLIGSFGTTTMIAIAMNMEGAMYGHDITSDSIYSINPTTGAATLIGLTGYAANYAQGMDFDNDDGTLYIFLYIGSGANVYGTVNLTTGAVTPLATDNPLGEFEGAIAIPGTPFDIPWASEDTLSGSLAGGACQDVTVTFDSTGLAAGDYFGALQIESNDPAMPMAFVDLQLTVFSTVTMVYYDLEDVVHIGENIYVAGDFNGWDNNLDMMTPNGDYSEFTFTFGILDGTYAYKYVVDTGAKHWNWLQSANRSMTVSGDTTIDDYRNVVPGYYELTWPDTMTVPLNTPSENVYGQIWADDLTSEGVQPRSLPVELGYGVDADPSLWTNWTLMSYNVSVGNNAEYMGTITPTEPGVFSYAIKLNPNWGTGNPNDIWYYADTEWDGVYLPADAGVMTVLFGVYLPLILK